MKKVALAAVVLALSVSFQAPNCPIDDSGAYFTGKTQTDRATGKNLKEYKCRRFGHLFWVKSR